MKWLKGKKEKHCRFCENNAWITDPNCSNCKERSQNNMKEFYNREHSLKVESAIDRAWERNGDRYLNGSYIA